MQPTAQAVGDLPKNELAPRTASTKREGPQFTRAAEAVENLPTLQGLVLTVTRLGKMVMGPRVPFSGTTEKINFTLSHLKGTIGRSDS